MSKEITLVNERGIALICESDFDYLCRFKWYYVDGYAARVETIDGKRRWILMHREIMNTPKGMDTDHINMNRLDNRRENLRIVTRSENMANTKGHKDKTLGNKIKGVFWTGSKWRSRICHKGKAIHLGVFDTIEEAFEAYKNASDIINGQFSNY